MEKQKKSDPDLFKELAMTLISVMEEKGSHLSGHSERVAGRCVNFSRLLNLPKPEIDKIYLAGLFHNIGMVYIPMEILQKPGKLNEDEMAMVKQHPAVSERILSNLSKFKGVLPIVRHHHEVFSGGGYPDGLQGEQIPIGSRILHLVDSYEAMIAARTYRPAMGMEEALDRIVQNLNDQYDPALVDRFVSFTRETTTIFQAQLRPKAEKGQRKKEPKAIGDFLGDIAENLRMGLEDLPVLPQVVKEIERVMRLPETDAKALSDVIERDAAISIRLIATANSPVFRGSEKLNTVQQAVTRLGLKETRGTIMSIAGKSIFKTGNKGLLSLMQKLWLHSLSSAYAARVLARRLALEDPDRYFLMGLIHDIGKVLLIKSLSDFSDQVKPYTLKEAVMTVQDLHCAFGADFLEQCKYTRDFVEVAMYHEKPRYFQTSKKGILVVNLANQISRTLGYSFFKEDDINLPGLECAKLLGAGFDVVGSATDEVAELMKTTANIF